jgi:hypothetical protein
LIAVAVLAAPAAAREPPFATHAEYLAHAGRISGDAAYEHLGVMTGFHKPRGGADGLMAVVQDVEATRRWGPSPAVTAELVERHLRSLVEARLVRLEAR